MTAFPTISLAIKAKSLLKAKGYDSRIGKAPPGLLKSCSFAVYFDTNDIDSIIKWFEENSVYYSGLLIRNAGEYKKII